MRDRIDSRINRKQVASGATLAMIVLVLLGSSASTPTQTLGEPRPLGADPQAGRAVIKAVACGICHAIPGISGAHGIVGPSLAEFGKRRLIGGVAPNRPAVLIQWVRDAPSIAPNTGMPEMPLTERQARDVAAYLLTLR